MLLMSLFLFSDVVCTTLNVASPDFILVSEYTHTCMFVSESVGRSFEFKTDLKCKRVIILISCQLVHFVHCTVVDYKNSFKR